MPLVRAVLARQQPLPRLGARKDIAEYAPTRDSDRPVVLCANKPVNWDKRRLDCWLWQIVEAAEAGQICDNDSVRVVATG